MVMLRIGETVNNSEIRRVPFSSQFQGRAWDHVGIKNIFLNEKTKIITISQKPSEAQVFYTHIFLIL
jgi:hypothetical protein